MEEIENKIWKSFLKGINEFNMIKDGDRIAVGISGGKDSLLLISLLKRVREEKIVNFEYEGITIDQGYEKTDLEKMSSYLIEKEIKNTIVDSNIWKVVFDEREEKNPCSLCSKMRRGILYREAEKRNCNKIALGHHLDDIVETVLINMFYSGNIKTMLPSVKSETGKFEVIRPLCYVNESDIISFTKYSATPAMKCGCKMYEYKHDSKRLQTKVMLTVMQRKNSEIKSSIFNSLKNVDTGYMELDNIINKGDKGA